MVMTRTGSMGSWVPPALTTMVRPVRSPVRPRVAEMWPSRSMGSTRRPMPTRPDARRPGAGPAMATPRWRSFSRFSCVAGWAYISASMAGATSSGAEVAMTVVVKGSSARPTASLAMQLTVAGAMTTMSARRARATCSLANSELTS